MFKPRFLLLSIASALCLLSLSFSTPQPQDNTTQVIQNVSPCGVTNDVFKIGEEITYTIYYNWNFVWVSAGEVTFNVSDSGENYFVSAKGKTYSSYEWMYSVRDNFESYINKKTLLPNVSVRDIHEGKYTQYERTDFDQPKRKATLLKGKDKKNADKRKEYALDDCMHDIISSVYYMRNLDFNTMKRGDQVPMKVFLDGEVHPIKVTYRGKNETSVKGMGKFKTIHITPQLIAGNVFKDGDKMNIWATDDNNRLPLLIESPIQVGTVKCVLKSYKNLMHPLTSKM